MFLSTNMYFDEWWEKTLLAILFFTLAFLINRYRIIQIRKQKIKLENLIEERTRQIRFQKEKIEQQKEKVEQHKKKIEEQKERVEYQKQRIELQKQILEGQKEKLEEKREQLALEKEKVEKLLFNVLPAETALELKQKGKARARSYSKATIMFTDIVGFTKIAERMRPGPLVARLDDYFSAFDQIIEKYKLEKIKTIGDSYMCAGGVPIRDKENAIYTVLAGLEIQRYMIHRKEEDSLNNRDYWELRVGINTGEVVAGVIGTKRFAYDVWGNAVNVANRMETTGEAGKVNISGKTFEDIEPYFECTYRGKIKAKNKGFIDMYFVEGIKASLSIEGNGEEPNDAFWKLVNLHIYSSINYMKSERFIMRFLRRKLPKNLYYHGIHHTVDVVKCAERLAIMEGKTDEDLFLLKTAANYHDAGFVEQYNDNEPIGVSMAERILPKFGYEPSHINQIKKLIYVTKIPHDPKSHLEEIICDADLDYLGRDDFFEISESLKKELMERDFVKSDRHWDNIQVKFLKMHQFFTISAQKLRNEKKQIHLRMIEERLEKGEYSDLS